MTLPFTAVRMIGTMCSLSFSVLTEHKVEHLDPTLGPGHKKCRFTSFCAFEPTGYKTETCGFGFGYDNLESVHVHIYYT